MGTAIIESLDIFIIVGITIMPRIIPPANTLNPLPPNVSRMKGTTTISPKNPYTTEGIPANNSTNLLSNDPTALGAISAINKAAANPRGTAHDKATRVTPSEPMNIAPMPYILLAGFQVRLNKKLLKPTWVTRGIPRANINTVIRIMDNMDMPALIINCFSITASLVTFLAVLSALLVDPAKSILLDVVDMLMFLTSFTCLL